MREISGARDDLQSANGLLVSDDLCKLGLSGRGLVYEFGSVFLDPWLIHDVLVSNRVCLRSSLILGIAV